MNVFNQKMFLLDVNSKLAVLIFHLSIFSAFLGSSIPAIIGIIFLFLINIQKVKFNNAEVIAMLMLVTYLAFALILSQDYTVILKNFRFWMGVIFYLIFLKTYNIKYLYSRNLLKIVCLTIIIETIAINLIDQNILINYIDIEQTKFFNFYTRPIGFTGSATMTSTALIILFYIIEKIQNKMSLLDWTLFSISILLIFSTTGYVIFFILILLKFTPIIKKIIFYQYRLVPVKSFAIFLIFILLIYLIIQYNYLLNRRVNIEYFTHIFYLKITEYKDAFNYLINPSFYCKTDCMNFLGNDINHNVIASFRYLIQLFGYQILSESPNTSGHNGLTIFIFSNGILGLCLYFITLYSFLRKNNFMLSGVLLIMIGSLHYPTAMSAAGQLFLASMIIINIKKQ